MPLLPCLIAFGANLGDPGRTLDAACEKLDACGVRIAGRSQMLRTAAVGKGPNQPDYGNAAVVGETQLSPREMIGVLLRIERELGRQRSGTWEPRTVDLDLLLLGGTGVREQGIRVPHPRMAWRRFVLQPASEIAGGMRHPVCGLTVAQLLARLDTLPRQILWIDPRGDRQSGSTVDSGNAGGPPLEDAALARQLQSCGIELHSGEVFASPAAEGGPSSSWKVIVVDSPAAALPLMERCPLVVWDSRRFSAAGLESRRILFHPGAVLDLADSPPGFGAGDELMGAVLSMRPPGP